MNEPGDVRDTTTPEAMVRSMSVLLLGQTLLPTSRALLIRWMQSSTRGRDRLRAGFPDNWLSGNKAGTGANGAFNDVAIAWPPNGGPILIAAYMSGGNADGTARAAALARIAAYVTRGLL